MMKMSKGGLVLTGLGAYLILSKGIHMVNRAVSDISDMMKWRAYYKAFAKTGRTDMAEPNHVEHNQDGTSSEATGKAVAEAITKTIDTLFNKPEAENEASEGQTEGIDDELYNVSEDEAVDIPEIVKELEENESETVKDDEK